jgi:4-hydroxy-tetrahydrodipicolinate reductase
MSTGTMVSVCIAGITGNVGSRVARAVLDAPDLSLVRGVARSAAGRPAAEVFGDDRARFVIAPAVTDVLDAPFDVLVDYTHPDAVYANTQAALSAGRHVVVGTSGLTDAEYEQLGRIARRNDAGLFAAGNFSVTAALLKAFAETAARHVPSREIIDYGPDTKPDAPSGTGRELAAALADLTARQPAADPDDPDHVEPGARGADLSGTRVHSVRVPGYYSSVEVHFGLPGERLTLRHDSMSYEPYVQGTLLAVRRVPRIRGLHRGLDTLLLGTE